ncbi:MAG: Ig-like domain-containing protein, partial [Gemmatimonadota bacterium]
MTRAIRHLALATVLALGVVSCGDDVSVTDPDPQANAILQISGDDQVLGTGEESAALVVRVNDQNGQPFPGATVAFSGSGADHSLSASSATTGSNGQASVTMTAGDEAGTVTVAATVAGVGTTSFTLTIEADEPDPEASTLEVVEGDGQTIEANATSAPLVVRVSDQFGSAFEGAEVTFTGDGVPHSLSATTAGTDADGEASVVVTAGGDAGTITVAASVDGLDPVTFTLTVEAPSGDPEAATLVRVSGNGQTIEPGETSAALVVRVDDQFSDPFPGAEVTFTVESGDGTVSSTTQTTGANGQASTTVTAGPTEGALTISASAAGLTPVIFDLTVEAPTVDPEISALVLLSGDGQTIEPSETSAALVVRVEDQFNNPFEGAEVTFAVESGDGTLTSTSETTAADGQASTTVTAGPTEGALT